MRIIRPLLSRRIAPRRKYPWIRIIAFITEPSSVPQILDHQGEPRRPMRFAPARGQPLWAAAAARTTAGNDPHWELAAQSLPEIKFEQLGV